MNTAYQLPDEPRPGHLRALAVNPMWPLLSFMFGGAWFALPWSVFNAFAIGSPDRKRALGVAILGGVGSVCLTYALFVLDDREILTGRVAIRLSLLVITLWKLAFAYILFNGQSRSFALYEYYGGIVRTGVLPILGAFYAWSQLEKTLPLFWRILLQ